MPRTEFERRDAILAIHDGTETLSSLEQDPGFREPPLYFNVVNRLVLKIENADLAAIPWETILQGTSRTIVRVSSVRPRFLNAALKLPLRILQLHPLPAHPVAEWVKSVFGSHPAEIVDSGVVVSTSETWSLPAEWPLVDILHLDQTSFSDTDLLSTSDPTQEGTLGWYSRWTNSWQVRLLILNCETSYQAMQARKLAHALCERAGPAVLVVEKYQPNFYSGFYEQIIHDFPLDIAGAGQTLFVGEGREEGVRVSGVAEAIIDLAEQRKLWLDAQFRALKLKSKLNSSMVEQEHVAFEAFQNKYDNWEFNLHESDGLIPMASEVAGLKQSLVRSKRIGRDIRSKPVQQLSGQRHVNSACWRKIGAQFTRISPDEGTLEPGAMYCLGIQIGENDLVGRALDATAIVEEIFHWAPDQPGVWVELAVVGIDFNLIGDPVQELWLPRTGETETAYFTVVPPPEREIATLRYGLYYKQNLIQSFRLAAYVGSSEDGSHTESNIAEKLGAALGVTPDRVGTAHYRARLEYSRTSALNQLEKRSEPAITITANNLQGRDIITIKGPNVIDTNVYPDGDMPNIVRSIRTALDEVGYGPVAGNSRQYQFGKYALDLDNLLSKALISLADVGNRLYLNLVPRPEDRAAVDKALSGDRRLIHVAQLLRDKVIPWSMVYDREFDSQNAPSACLAVLPASGSTLRATECGTHPECLLHQNAQGQKSPRDVVCPLHFWGFRHIIEIPPQQVVDEAEPHEEITCIKPKNAIQVAAGLNENLPTCSDHWTTLSNGRNWGLPKYSRTEIIQQLRDQEPDLIYFFCHARGGETEEPRTDPPFLEFQPQGIAVPQKIRPQDLAYTTRWSHGPLVFLNACGTLGYTPAALSPFLKALVDGRGASGVLGTEVPVAESLAGEVASSFFRHFVSGESAGDALLEVRRELLGKKNPLGLVYTLFAPAALAIDVNGDGKCE